MLTAAVRLFEICFHFATFNNISAILQEVTGIPGENHRPAASH
jgi:hypothetical protein